MGVVYRDSNEMEYGSAYASVDTIFSRRSLRASSLSNEGEHLSNVQENCVVRLLYYCLSYTKGLSPSMVGLLSLTVAF